MITPECVSSQKSSEWAHGPVQHLNQADDDDDDDDDEVAVVVAGYTKQGIQTQKFTLGAPAIPAPKHTHPQRTKYAATHAAQPSKAPKRRKKEEPGVSPRPSHHPRLAYSRLIDVPLGVWGRDGSLAVTPSGVPEPRDEQSPASTVTVLASLLTHSAIVPPVLPFRLVPWLRLPSPTRPPSDQPRVTTGMTP